MGEDDLRDCPCQECGKPLREHELRVESAGVREARSHRSNMDPEMSTKGRGSILPAERAERAWPPGRGGLKGRNAFQEPDHFIVGDHGYVGGNDPLNSNDLDGDWDAGPWGDDGKDAAPNGAEAWQGGS